MVQLLRALRVSDLVVEFDDVPLLGDGQVRVGQRDGHAAEDVRAALRLAPVLVDDDLERHLLHVVNLAHAVQRAQQQHVHVATVQQPRRVKHDVLHHRVRLQGHVTGG